MKDPASLNDAEYPPEDFGGMRKDMVQPGIGCFTQSSKSLAKSLCKACLCDFKKHRLSVTQSPRAKLHSGLFCMCVIAQIC